MRRPLLLARLPAFVAAGALAVGAAATAYVVVGGDEQDTAAPIHVVGDGSIDLRDDYLDGLADGARQGRGSRPDRSDRAGRTAAQVPDEPGTPQRLVIPRLGVDSTVVPITAPGGVLTPPDDAQQVGWWSPGAEPGAEVGSALLTGHTLSRGGAALQDLEALRTGDRMTVRTGATRIDYLVQTVEVLDKQTVATRAAELFSQTTAGRLVVITCEDYDGDDYLSNVVVTANPVMSTTTTAS